MVRGKAVAFAAVALVAACLACGAQETSSPLPVVGGAASTAAPRADACPLTIDGVSADIETTGRGVAVNLSASPDQLLLLRARATAAASTAGGVLAACPCGSADAGVPPAADVTIEDFEGGTRLVVSALDPSDAPALASRMRTQLALVHGGDCPKP